MEIERIDELISWLDENDDIEKQKLAVDTLSRFEISELTDFVFNKVVFHQPKSTWRNAICAWKYVDKTQLSPVIPQLLTMLQDMNWPGSQEASDILCGIDKNVLLPPLEKAVSDANAAHDTMWLGALRQLVEYAGIQREDFRNETTYACLQKADF